MKLPIRKVAVHLRLTQSLPGVFLSNILEFRNLLADWRVQERLEVRVGECRQIHRCLRGHGGGEPPVPFRSEFVDEFHKSALI